MEARGHMNHYISSVIERALQTVKISNNSSEIQSSSETNSCQDVKNVTSYPLDERFRLDPEGSFAALAPADRKVFDELLHYYFRYDVIYPTHETIAKRYDMHEDTVQKSTKKLANLGIISKRFRLGASCVYRISYFFTNNPDMLFRLRHMFKSISGFILRAALTYSVKSLSVVTTGRLEILRHIYKYTNLQIVRGVSMNKGIPLAVQRIDAPLNVFQQCQISACTDEAIDHANLQYFQRRATIDNAFAYILKTALEYDLDRNLTPNTKLAGDLAFALGVSPANPGPITGKTEQVNNELITQPLKEEEGISDFRFPKQIGKSENRKVAPPKEYVNMSKRAKKPESERVKGPATPWPTLNPTKKEEYTHGLVERSNHFLSGVVISDELRQEILTASMKVQNDNTSRII